MIKQDKAGRKKRGGVCSDDVQVTQVNVVITDGGGAVSEQGQAVSAGSLWWEYTTTQAAPEGPQVVVTARDLPGHIAQMNWD